MPAITRKLIAATIAAITTTAITANDKTTRRPLRVDPTAFVQESQIVAEDTITALNDRIAISGYDKPLRSTGESFFITNNSDTTIDGLEVTIDYRDMSHRQLHRRTVRIDISVPAGETRRADIRSWDKRLTFYYCHGVVPRTENVVPYDVAITVDRLFIHPRQE